MTTTRMFASKHVELKCEHIVSYHLLILPFFHLVAVRWASAERTLFLDARKICPASPGMHQPQFMPKLSSCHFWVQVAITQALLAQQPQGAGAQASRIAPQGAAPVDLSAVSVATVDSFQARCKTTACAFSIACLHA